MMRKILMNWLAAILVPWLQIRIQDQEPRYKKEKNEVLGNNVAPICLGYQSTIRLNGS